MARLADFVSYDKVMRVCSRLSVVGDEKKKGGKAREKMRED